MIRTIWNAFAGRKKRKSEFVRLEELIDSLSDLDNSVKVYIEDIWETYDNAEIMTPNEARKYMEDNFENYLGKTFRIWTIVKHQIYRGNKNEKHYFDLTKRHLKECENFSITKVEGRGTVKYLRDI